MSQRHNQAYRCFPTPQQPAAVFPLLASSHLYHPLQRWQQQYGVEIASYSDTLQHTLCGLLPLLLCGEQSAQLVFNTEINRLCSEPKAGVVAEHIVAPGGESVATGQLTASHCSSHRGIASADKRSQRAGAVLQSVEADEWHHDQALQFVLSQLAAERDNRRVQQQARRFFTSLSRVDSLAMQFVRIAVLDTCVTRIMQGVELGRLGRQHSFAQLCGLIRRDESRHVYVAREHARALGAKRDDFAAEADLVLKRLQNLLSLRQHEFEWLGVDLDRLCAGLEDKWR